DGAAFGREFDQPGGQRLSVLLPTCGASGIGGVAPGLAIRPPVDCSGASLQRRTTGKALHGGLCAAAGSRLPDDGVWWRAADQRSVSSPGGGSAERPAPNSGGARQRQELCKGGSYAKVLGGDVYFTGAMRVELYIFIGFRGSRGLPRR